MQTLSKTVVDVEHIVSFQKQIIGVDPEESADAWGRVESDVVGKRRTMLAAVQDLQGKGGMLDLESSSNYCDFNELQTEFEFPLRTFTSISRKVFCYGSEGACSSPPASRGCCMYVQS